MAVGDNDHVKKLKAARAMMVKARRDVADALGQPYQRGDTENTTSRFIELQNAIEAIDRAISDEKEVETSSRARV